MQDTAMVRNIAVIGHGNSGKTSLVEAMLYTAGKINRLGKVDDGNSSMDYDDEEIKRKSAEKIILTKTIRSTIVMVNLNKKCSQ